jgi:hypothetical protein
MIKIYKIERWDTVSEIPKKTRDLVSDLKIDLGMLYKKA